MILLISFVSLNCFADSNVAKLLKGQPAPFDGVLFDGSTANELTQSVLERDKYKLLTESLQRETDLLKQNNELQDKKVNILLEQNTKLYTTLKDARDVSNVERIVWVGLGILTTGLVFYGAQKITK